MSELVLQMPSNYVDIEKDEMEYVDGGATLQKTWYGYLGTLNKSECSDLSNLIWMGTGVAGVSAAVTGYFSLGVGTLVSGITGGILAIGAGYLGIAANHNGVNFRIVNNKFVLGGIRW